MEISQLLQLAVERNASDLHINPGYFPSLQINGELYFLKQLPIITGQQSEKILLGMFTPDQKEVFLTNKEIDIGYDYNGNRFRVNIYLNRGEMAGAFRLVPMTIKTVSQLNLPPILSEFTKPHQGLVLLTGPTGEGK